jgi:hypothetical protein
MHDFIHADIFFIVTTVAVAIVAIGFTVLLFYVIAILRRVRDIAEEVRQETKLVREDVRKARMRIDAEGFRLRHVLDVFSWFQKKAKIKKSKAESKK